jgi:hypothetical protein
LASWGVGMFALRRLPYADARRHRAVRWLDDKFQYLPTVSENGYVGGLAGSSSKHKFLAALAVVLLAGCSVHPIPDDVSPIPTQEIVRSARCEMRLGVFDQVKVLLEKAGITNVDISDLQTPEGRKRVLPKPPPELQAILDNYGKVAVAYDFDFEITEHNNLDSSLAFKLPFTPPSVLDLGAAGSLHKTRFGKRTFSAQETFADLILRVDWCDGFEVRRRNLLYPITGSIGLRKVMETFIAISEQGGGKESFVDALAFTTTISGSVNPSLKLNPVPSSFRLVSASLTASADRTDLHKVKISLAFPVPEKPKKKKDGILLPVDPNEPGTAPYVYNPVWRARYNICVADARDREDTFKTLRFTPPEVYCISYADTFVPRTSVDALIPRTATEDVAPRGAPVRPTQQPRPRSWW